MNFPKIKTCFIKMLLLLITVCICTTVFAINEHKAVKSVETHEKEYGLELTTRQLELADIVVEEIHL